MIKIVDWAKRHDNIVVFFVILVSILGISLNVKITASDELWNFQNIYKIYNGLEIYEDANIIITPLFFYVGNFLFKLFGANFFVFRIYNIMIDLVLFFSTYILCKKIKFSKKMSLIIVFILMSIYNFCLIRAMANYNILALAFFVIGFINILKEKMTVKDYIFQGIMMFLIFATKQNIGVYYILASIILQLIKKEEMKEKIKNTSIELGVFIILTLALFIFLIINNNFSGFINYTFMGIREFGNKNISVEFIYFVQFISIMLIDIIASYVLIKKIKIDKEKVEILKKFNIFAFFLIFTIVPIMNLAHFLIGSYLYLIALAYIISIILKDILPKNEKLIKIIVTVMLIIIISFSIYQFISWSIYINSDGYMYEYNDPFYGGIVDKDTIEKIEIVEEYINNNDRKVIILSGESAMYMVPLKQNNGKMDLAFKGNLGREGEQGLIEEIKELTNTNILIEKDEENVHEQESELVREYIMENLMYNGEIGDFLIYSTE